MVSGILFFFRTKYHGGTNFGRTAGGPFITTSYDYDAPLDEYGKFRNIEFCCQYDHYLYLLFVYFEHSGDF